MAYEMEINGERRTLDVPGEQPLLWALRDALGLTGTKYGCGIGLCGVCLVHVDGRPARSCVLSVSDAAGARITSIEGLGDGGLHPVQRAWVEEDVSQCGYCQPGQIMAAAALLAETPDPSDDEVDAALSGVLCRCGSYPRIRQAVRRAAEQGRQR